jgi:hypothetical protein
MLMRLYPSEREQLLEARKHLEAAIILQPQFQLAHFRLAEVDRKLGNMTQRQN